MEEPKRNTDNFVLKKNTLNLDLNMKIQARETKLFKYNCFLTFTTKLPLRISGIKIDVAKISQPLNLPLKPEASFKKKSACKLHIK